MNRCLNVFLFACSLSSFNPSFANDGAFRASGNQLIPMYETDVSVKKEILTIRRINATQAAIVVYYEFFNPKENKEIEVGFEASSPSGDVDHTVSKDGQPYINDFTVSLNEVSIPYKVTIVKDKIYYRDGKFKSVPLAAAIKQSQEEEDAAFIYVYHFKAVFKKGVNIIRHTYTVDLSSGISEDYSLDYILTAAKRWANRQIDDFTLQIDMGELQDLCIANSFFKASSEWMVPEGVKAIEIKDKVSGEKTIAHSSEFFIRKGMLVFQQKNFKPAGELDLQSRSLYFYYNAENPGPHPDRFDSKRDDLPFSIDLQDNIHEPLDELSKRIIKNLPFARRGYVFKSPEIKTFYERQKWYWPDPAYAPVVDQLTRKEQEWLKKR